MGRVRTSMAAAAAAATVVACGGGEVLAVLSFLGTAGGSWEVANPTSAVYEQLRTCGRDAGTNLGTGPGTGTDNCVVNIQIQGARSLYATSFDVRYSGSLTGCPPSSAERLDGKINGNAITLPSCFSGRYVTINEAVSDDGTIRAYFDTEVPNVSTGVWVEIQQGVRRFKFGSGANQAPGNPNNCELSTPRTAATLTVVPADLDSKVLQTTVTLSVGAETWTGRFEGVSGLALTRAGGERLDLQRRDLPDTCI